LGMSSGKGPRPLLKIRIKRFVGLVYVEALEKYAFTFPPFVDVKVQNLP